ncbi:hypothetical protein HY408_01010 [Candidatus Gottesmanbacteria bacterium]|nr:hypothetical protein [Candidatus Gottesmanbacteria bacterium]
MVNNSQNIRNLFLTPIKSPLFPKVNLNTLKNEYRNFTTAQKKELKSCVIAEMGTDKTQEVLEELRSKNLPDDYTLKVISDCINTVNKDGVDVDREKDSAGNDTELVKPALRDPSRWGDARCNDGTPFAFRVEKPQLASDTWIIYLQGGGMCDDNALSCQDRLASAPKLTTTFPGTDGQKSSQFSNSGIFNHDPKINPLFYHANKVHGSYCSSDLWSGNTSLRRKTSADPNGWYFSGRLNIKAIFESLTELYGLDDNNKNTKILLTGGSAGCMGANIGAEMAINYFPNAAKDGRLKLLSDGCFFPDFNNLEYPLGISDETSRQVLVKAYDFFGSVINTTCEKEQKNKNEPPGSCFLGAILHPYLTNCNGKGLCLPHLIQNSSIDHSLLVHLNIDPKPGPNNIGLELVRSQMLKELSAPDINWLFSGGNVSYHTLTQNDEMWQYGPGKGRTYGDVVNSFWKEEEPQKIIFGNP